MFLVYNVGYYSGLSLKGKHTYKWYKFKKRFVTKVDNEDGKIFLKMTSKDITYCPTVSKDLPPFMKLEDWCAGKKGRYSGGSSQVYDPEEYKALFLLK